MTRDESSEAPAEGAPNSAEPGDVCARHVVESAPGFETAESPDAPPLATELARCWRCARWTPGGPDCRWCAAPIAASAPAVSSPAASTTGRHPLITLLVGYAIMLAFSAIVGLVHHAMQEDKDKPPSIVEFNAPTIIVDGLWLLTMLSIGAFLPRPAVSAPLSIRRRALAWSFGLPILAALLALNLLYHHFVIEIIDGHWMQELLTPRPPTVPELAFAFVSICVMPGIVEEWFFRYQSQGHLRDLVGTPMALVIASIMFGLAHVYVPLSIPVLTVVGFGLGVVRVWSGSIVLPMILHTLHNAIIVAMEVNEW